MGLPESRMLSQAAHDRGQSLVSDTIGLNAFILKDSKPAVG